MSAADSNSRPTYRERREAKAERLRGWADKREVKAEQAYEGTKRISDAIPFGQPILVGHHSEKGHRAAIKRIDQGMRAAVENDAKAARMREKADNIERAAKRAIYSDDPDAIEALEAKLAKLEAQRAAVKAKNAEYRKEHKAELKGMSAYQKDQALPFQSYVLKNLGGTITATRKRLEQLKRGPSTTDRVIPARYAGSCADCGAAIERGDMIRYSKAAGARCAECES